MTSFHHLLLLASLLSTNSMMASAAEASTEKNHGNLRRSATPQQQQQKQPQQQRQLKPSNRIVGGHSVESKFDYPFFGLLGQACGASLVAPDMVITAAHCSKAIEAGEKFAFGNLKRDRSDAETLVGASASWMHPLYGSMNGYNYDFMLVKLEEAVKDKKPIVMNFDANVPLDGDSQTTIGFGSINNPTFITPTTVDYIEYPNQLQQVEVNYVENCKAPNLYYHVLSFVRPANDQPQMCAGVLDKGGKDSCFGDSGGPLFFTKDNGDYVQTGITSWGEGCGDPTAPGIYSRLSYAKDWLQEHICTNSEFAHDFEFCETDNNEEDEEESPEEEEEDRSPTLTLINIQESSTPIEEESESSSSSSQTSSQSSSSSSTVQVSVTLPTAAGGTPPSPQQQEKEEKEVSSSKGSQVHVSVNVDLP